MIKISDKKKEFIDNKIIDIYESLSDKQLQYIETNEELEEEIMTELYRKNFQKLKEPEEFHYLMLHWNWDEGNHIPRAVTEHSNCDRGTALMVFWQLDPSYFYSYKAIKEIPIRLEEDYQMFKNLEHRLLKNEFKTSKIKFVPSSIASWKSREDPNIPSELKVASEGEEFEE